MARRQGFDTLFLSGNDLPSRQTYEDEGRYKATVILHDIYQMARVAIPGQAASDRINFSVIIGRKTQHLSLHIGPGDQGEPVLTLMLPNED